MDQIKKRFLLFLIFGSFNFLVFSVSPVKANSTANLIFINHVRGTECCDQGSLENFKLQLSTFVKYDLPVFFALRYDVLIDPQFKKIIAQYKNKSQIQFGVMLEITPNLAKEAFVEYKDAPENWYQAQNAFLIGYSPADRVLLADKIFAAYHAIFGKYPELTAAWQVDTPTLNYLREKYGLIVHQIAREQWGLDSYTLDGGPPHYPYLASKNWFFNPDFTDPNNLLILRHTIDDPLYTYGDQTSAFTSQPNDYSLDKKDFSYFEKLLDQAVGQPNQPGFANLGLENSMDTVFQQEYLKQIAKISELKKNGKITLIDDLKILKQNWQNQKITIHQGADFISSSGPNRDNTTAQKVFWITTPKYRLRLRFAGQKVFISDLRVYHPDLMDPYTQNNATNKGYLINPYLINDGIIFPGIQTPTLAQRFLNIPMINSFTAQPKQDLNSNLNFLALPNITDPTSLKIGSTNVISYISTDKFISFSFNEDTFELRNAETDQIVYTASKLTKNPIQFKKVSSNPASAQKNEIFWEVGGIKALSTTWDCADQICHFEFNLDPIQFSQMIATQYPFIFPEKKARPLSEKNTIVYVHNHYAIAGRNPVRVVLVPQDDNGFPTNSQKDVIVATTPKADFVNLEKQTASREYQLLDISNNTSTKIALNLTLDEISLPEQTIFFAPNCKTQLTYCLTHPQKFYWYARTIFEDKFRAKLLGEKQT